MQALNRRQLMTGAMRHKISVQMVGCLQAWPEPLTQMHSCWLPLCPQVSLAPNSLEHEFPWFTSCGVRKGYMIVWVDSTVFLLLPATVNCYEIWSIGKGFQIQGKCLQKMRFSNIKNTSPNRSEYWVALGNSELLYLMLLIFCHVPLQKWGGNNFSFSWW